VAWFRSIGWGRMIIFFSGRSLGRENLPDRGFGQFKLRMRARPKSPSSTQSRRPENDGGVARESGTDKIEITIGLSAFQDPAYPINTIICGPAARRSGAQGATSSPRADVQIADLRKERLQRKCLSDAGRSIQL